MSIRLETQRLILRKPTIDDVPAEAEFYASDRARFVGGKMSRELVWRTMAMVIGHWDMRGYGYFAIEEKSSGDYAGRVGCWYPDGWPEPEFSWCLMGNHEGKGLAFEAAKAVRNWAYSDLGWTTAVSMIDPANVRSEALAKRLGAEFAYDFDHERYGKCNVWRHAGPKVVIE